MCFLLLMEGNGGYYGCADMCAKVYEHPNYGKTFRSKVLQFFRSAYKPQNISTNKDLEESHNLIKHTRAA
jgi:hypothetical protein